MGMWTHNGAQAPNSARHLVQRMHYASEEGGKEKEKEKGKPKRDESGKGGATAKEGEGEAASKEEIDKIFWRFRPTPIVLRQTVEEYRKEKAIIRRYMHRPLGLISVSFCFARSILLFIMVNC